MSLSAFFEKLAADPYRSFRRFLIGFALFIAGLLPLLYAPPWIWLNRTALLLLFIGFALAVYGYLGIIANRILRFIRE